MKEEMGDPLSQTLLKNRGGRPPTKDMTFHTEVFWYYRRKVGFASSMPGEGGDKGVSKKKKVVFLKPWKICTGHSRWKVSAPREDPYLRGGEDVEGQ